MGLEGGGEGNLYAYKRIFLKECFEVRGDGPNVREYISHFRISNNNVHCFLTELKPLVKVCLANLDWALSKSNPRQNWSRKLDMK